MARRPLRNWEHCEPITETMALFEICASVGVVLKRWFSSGGDIGKNVESITCACLPRAKISSLL